MVTKTLDLDVMFAVGKLRFEAEARGAVREGDMDVFIMPVAREVLAALTAEWPDEYFAGKAAMGLFARTFLGRLVAEGLILIPQVSVLHSLLWRCFDELEPLMNVPPAVGE